MVIEEDWLIRIFAHENFEDLYLTVRGREQTCFRLMYADATGKTQDGEEKVFHVFLKYHMSVVDLVVEDPRTKEYYASERYWYDVLYPCLVEFQREKGVDTPFNNVPKCYGTIQDDINQVLIQRVLVLEDLKVQNYKVWNNVDPLPRRHLELVLEAYAKLHATSAAMQKLQPEKFNDIIHAVREFEHRRNTALKTDEKYAHFEPSLIRLFSFLHMSRQEEAERAARLAAAAGASSSTESSSTESPSSETKSPPTSSPAKEAAAGSSRQKDDAFLERGATLWAAKSTGPCMKVIMHGDCWTSNYLSKFEDEECKTSPLDLMIVDWQLMKYGSLICDVATFLFTFVSEEDMEHLNVILQYYYYHFSTHLRKLGIENTDEFYSYDQFKVEWKQLCKYGFIATFHALVAGCDGRGSTSTDVCMDVAVLTQRMKHVVKYLRQYNLMEL